MMPYKRPTCRHMLILIVALISALCMVPLHALDIGNFTRADDVSFITRNGIPYPTDYKSSNRNIVSLDGKWKFATAGEAGANEETIAQPGYDRSSWREIDVPGTWDTSFGDELLHYKGIGYYATEFHVDSSQIAGYTKLVFRGSFLTTRVYLNGEFIGGSTSGYTPFYFDITNVLNDGSNTLVAVVDNRIGYATIPINTFHKKDLHGWWPYGGLHRSVYLEFGKSKFSIFRADIRTENSGKFSADISVYNSSPDIARGKKLKAHIIDPDNRIVYSFQPMHMDIEGGEVRSFNMSGALNSPRLWDTVSPGIIYSLKLTITDIKNETPEDDIVYEFGFRSFEIKGTKIYLNGREHFLYGINRHEDDPETGLHQTRERLAEDLALLKELHVNHIRAGHYPADSRFLEMLRNSGITITEEIPVYQLSGDQMADPDIVSKCIMQLEEMIERDRNNPAIIIWSLANEIVVYHAAAGPFVQQLHDAAKRLDPARPTTVEVPALELFTGGDFASPIVDIVSINEYFGWYYGDNRGLSAYLDKVHKSEPDKPMILSEFGAGTLLGKHVDKPGPEPNDDHSYSEEFQEKFYLDHFKIIFSKDFVVGTMPWAFADFRMEWKQSTGKPHPVDQMNLKGLLSHNREKKAAFDTVKMFYSKHSEKYGYK